ncbi:Rhodanese-like domain [Sesbania bispinosa]|nr:Rhodanese-like domain [Sesbania bispinosa]
MALSPRCRWSAIVLLPFVFCSSAAAKVVTLDVHAAKRLIQTGHTYLDVRTVKEFMKGHVDAAKIFNIPYMLDTPKGRVKNPDFLKEVSSACTKEDNLIVGCQSGVRSLYATTDLLADLMDHTEVEIVGRSVNGTIKLNWIADMEGKNGEGRSLAETPTWAVATVITILVSFSFLSNGTLKKLVKWLDRTKRKSLLSALEKIQEELMLFGLLSLMMGHWIVFVARICVKSSVISSRFFPCAMEKNFGTVEHIIWSNSEHSNKTVLKEQVNNGLHNYCPEGHESLASYESLEQLHRFVFVLGITHVSYSFVAVALAMIKIYSWRTWENEAKTMAVQSSQAMFQPPILEFHQRADYMALRLGFITNHELPLTYDFHNYMLRSMDDEFRDIVGLSVPLWTYAICCIFLNFHGKKLKERMHFEMSTFLWSLMGSRFKSLVVSENVRKSLSKWQKKSEGQTKFLSWIGYCNINNIIGVYAGWNGDGQVKFLCLKQ